MVSLDNIIKQNVALSANLENLVVVVSGGTGGIGESTAYKFAKYTKSPTIYIVGRNKEAGARVLENLKKINDDNAKYYFLSHDLSLITEADKVVESIKAVESKVNVLFLSSGLMDLSKKKTETAEGIEKRLAINYYTRWRIVDGLADLLKVAGDAEETARVVSVLHAGGEFFARPDDYGLKDNFSFANYGSHVVALNSTAALRFARVYPTVSFNHGHPGFVQTGVLSNLPWYLRYPATGIIKIFGATPDESGERFYYLSATAPEFARGGHLVSEKDEDVTDKSKVPKKTPAGTHDWWSVESQDAAWLHTSEEFVLARAATKH